MTPLAQQGYWQRIIKDGLWVTISNEDLMMAVLTRTARTDEGILRAVYVETVVRATRIAKAGTYPTEPNRQDYVEHAVGRVKLAIRRTRSGDSKILCQHFATAIRGWVRGARTKHNRRAKLLQAGGQGTLSPAHLSPSLGSIEIAMDFRRILDASTQEVQRTIALRAAGLTNAEVGKALGVSESTIRRWMEATGLRGLLAA